MELEDYGEPEESFSDDEKDLFSDDEKEMFSDDDLI